MHCKSVGRKKLPFSTVGRSPEKFENHCSNGSTPASSRKRHQRERGPLPNSQRLSSPSSLAYVQTKFLLESPFAEPLWGICFVGSWLCPQPLPTNLGSSWHLSASFWLFPQAFGSSFLQRHFVGAFRESSVRDECLFSPEIPQTCCSRIHAHYRFTGTSLFLKFAFPPLRRSL
ncbi:hypothetical protein T10_3808 [Trichinella papuae]|uniref:Uncharacterized protein n=1 Tax=Trichinella papuae TaxID=268474 RepID=A0A0V1M9E9_9BILA|nr:hypothetical protein T10_3808 [Trichinella papuae]